MRRGRPGILSVLVLALAAAVAHADPAPIDGVLFPIDQVTGTGVSPNAFTVTFRDLTLVSTGFQVQYAFDPNAPDDEWTDAAAPLPPRRINSPAGGFRSVAVVVPGLALADPTIVYFRARATVTHGSPGDPVTDFVNGPWAGPDGAILGPRAPSNVAVQISNAGLPLVTWTNNAAGDPLWAGTFIYRSEPNLPLKLYATLPTSADSFFDTAVKPGTKYTYVVVAYRQTSILTRIEQSTSNGIPAQVSIVTPNTPPPNVPLAPTALGAVAVDSTSIRLNWTDNAVNENGFVVERSLDDGATFTIRATINTIDLQTYVDRNLFPGGTYTYRVRAYNAGGQSDPSNTATATTPSLPPPVWSSPDANKPNQVQVYECAIWGTANYAAGVRDVFVLVIDTVTGDQTPLPLAPVGPTTNDWRIDWHTYEFAPGRYHLKAYSHANVNGVDLYSAPANVLGWTVAADSLPCSVRDQ